MFKHKVLSILIFSCFFYFNSGSSASLLEGFKTSKKATKVDQRRSVGSASRSLACEKSTADKSIELLVPRVKVAHQTLSSHPTLYFYSHSDQPVKVKFVLVNPQKTEPLLEQTILVNQKGIQKIILPPKMSLHEETVYLWNIAIGCSNSNNQEVLTAGIERVSISSKLANEIKNANSDAQKAQIYAQNGIWYESLDSTINGSSLGYDIDVEDFISTLEKK